MCDDRIASCGSRYGGSAGMPGHGVSPPPRICAATSPVGRWRASGRHRCVARVKAMAAAAAPTLPARMALIQTMRQEHIRSVLTPAHLLEDVRRPVAHSQKLYIHALLAVAPVRLAGIGCND